MTPVGIPPSSVSPGKQSSPPVIDTDEHDSTFAVPAAAPNREQAAVT
jgi:hypothetical protein